METRITGAVAGVAAGIGRADRLLLLLGAILVLEIGVAAALHRSDKEWNSLWMNGGASERVLALQVLTHRAPGREVDERLIREMLESPQALIREFAFTNSIAGLGEPTVLRRYLDTAPRNGESFRQAFFLRYRAGPVNRLDLDDLSRYLRSLPSGSGASNR